MGRLTWQYYAGTGTVTIKGKDVESLNLPRDVLDKFYHGNAVRLMPGMKNTSSVAFFIASMKGLL